MGLLQGVGCGKFVEPLSNAHDSGQLVKHHSNTAERSELVRYPPERPSGELAEHSNERRAGEMVQTQSGTVNSSVVVEQSCETVGVKLLEHADEIIGGESTETYSHSSTDDNELLDHNKKLAVHRSGSSDSNEFVEHHHQRATVELAEDSSERFDEQLVENHDGSDLVERVCEAASVSLEEHPKDRLSGGLGGTRSVINDNELANHNNERVDNELIEHHSSTAERSELVRYPPERPSGELAEHSNERRAGEMVQTQSGTVNSSVVVEQSCETVGVKLLEHADEIIGGESTETYSHSSTDDNELLDHNKKLAVHRSGSSDSNEFVEHHHQRATVELAEDSSERFDEQLVENHDGSDLVERVCEAASVSLEEHPKDRLSGGLGGTRSVINDNELANHNNERVDNELIEHHSSTDERSELVRYPPERPSGELAEHSNERRAGEMVQAQSGTVNSSVLFEHFCETVKQRNEIFDCELAKARGSIDDNEPVRHLKKGISMRLVDYDCDTTDSDDLVEQPDGVAVKLVEDSIERASIVLATLHSNSIDTHELILHNNDTPYVGSGNNIHTAVVLANVTQDCLHEESLFLSSSPSSPITVPVSNQF
jgi:hypothetical protein